MNALAELRRMALAARPASHPTYQVKTFKGLTRSITDFIKLSGGKVEALRWTYGYEDELGNWEPNFHQDSNVLLQVSLHGKRIMIGIEIGNARHTKRIILIKIFGDPQMYWTDRNLDSFVKWFKELQKK
jgi:hypothetical protein